MIFGLIVFMSNVFQGMSHHTATRRIGEVRRIIDGDTLEIAWMNTSGTARVRLWGIDAPEQDQPGGEAATMWLSRRCYAKKLRVRLLGTDQYDRTLGELLDDSGRNINEEEVRAGMAWWYQRYAGSAGDLAAAQREAESARRGLWAAPDPEAPWDWRHSH